MTLPSSPDHHASRSATTADGRAHAARQMRQRTETGGGYLVPWQIGATAGPHPPAGTTIDPPSDITISPLADYGLDRPGTGPLRARPAASAQVGAAPRPGTAGRIDLDRAARAVADLLDALGVDRRSEHLAATPARVARAYAELLTPEPFESTTFPNDEGYDELVVVRAITFSSLCEHHLLPFRGIAHVGYLPDNRLIGLSKLARVVTFFARRLQVQERLTTQVADWLDTHLRPRGVGVVLEADHACMSVRGVHAGGSRTVTSALGGLVRDDPRTRAEFFSLIGHPS